MMTKRQHERFNVDITEINGNIIFANEVSILNISPGGISLRADRRLNMGKEYTIKIKVDDSSVSVTGKVVWSLLSESRNDSNGNFMPIYTAGIQFANSSKEKIEEIIDLIKKQRMDNDNNNACHRDFDFTVASHKDNETVLANSID